MNLTLNIKGIYVKKGPKTTVYTYNIFWTIIIKKKYISMIFYYSLVVKIRKEYVINTSGLVSTRKDTYGDVRIRKDY